MGGLEPGVRFYLLHCSVACVVESLSLFDLFFVSRFMCAGG